MPQKCQKGDPWLGFVGIACPPNRTQTGSQKSLLIFQFLALVYYIFHRDSQNLIYLLRRVYKEEKKRNWDEEGKCYKIAFYHVEKGGWRKGEHEWIGQNIKKFKSNFIPVYYSSRNVTVNHYGNSSWYLLFACWILDFNVAKLRTGIKDDLWVFFCFSSAYGSWWRWSVI